MPQMLLPSALITDHGQRVLLRLQGKVYEITQEKLRTLLGLPAGPAGLGITIEGEHVQFEFAADDRTVDMSAAQLHRRLTKQTAADTPNRRKKA
jgi:hypothetical protein